MVLSFGSSIRSMDAANLFNCRTDDRSMAPEAASQHIGMILDLECMIEIEPLVIAGFLWQESVPCEDFATCGVVKILMRLQSCDPNLVFDSESNVDKIIGINLVRHGNGFNFLWDAEAQFQNRRFPKNAKQQAREE